MGIMAIPPLLTLNFYFGFFTRNSIGRKFYFFTGEVSEIKLITFDFEGTLVDFQWKLAEAEGKVLKMLEENGVAGELRGCTNYASVYNLVRKKEEEWGFTPGRLISSIDSIYDTYDLDAASRWKPVEGIIRALDPGEGYKTALVSNVGKKGLDKALLKFGLKDCFGMVVTRNDVRLLKPSGEGLCAALKWAGAGKEKAIHIGDSLSDIWAAKNAGVKIGIVLGGENKPEDLLREKPDLVLEKLGDLPGALRSMGF